MSALEASKWFQITYSNLTNVLTSISKRFGTHFGQITHFAEMSTIMLAYILLTQIDKFSQGGNMTKRAEKRAAIG